MNHRRFLVFGLLGLVGLSLFALCRPLMAWTNPGNPPRRPRSVDSALSEFGAIAKAKFAPACKKAKIPYPPKRLYLLAFKEEKQLEVWGAGTNGPYRHLATYPILAASGEIGPKRKEGDYQVPEGFYRLTTLNPNSRFHLSIRVDYPNAEDIEHKTVAQSKMGGDIYIHGNQLSIGCLALGDPAIEEIFPLVAQVPLGKRNILIAPVDLRSEPVPTTEEAWLGKLYQRMQTKLRADF